uniref:Probable RuBisCO transcriptional regulator n=1 Tax=Actinocyclus sp. (in: diatoms) TaxID=1923973 RepID=A0A9E9BQL3_9STRA|nr:lysR transcriptional regulator [Actinocyclus sp. (in: diatoms)]
MTLPFTLQQLRILKAVAAEENFTRAAEILYISQPTLSKQIKLLESRLGILLIDRQTRNFSLTEGGKIFLRYSERILTLCEESCRSLNDFKNGDRGSLIIGASQTVGTYLIPRILSLFAQTYPQINFKVQVESTHKISKSILNRQIDIAIVGGLVPEELKNNLQIEDFVEDNLNLILPKSHPFILGKKKFIKKSELYSLNFISLKSTSTVQKFIDSVLIQNDIQIEKFNIIMELDSIEAIKTAVDLGIGAAFVSSSAIEKEIQLKTISVINIKDTKITRPISILTNPQSYKSKAFKFFYRELSQLKI